MSTSEFVLINTVFILINFFYGMGYYRSGRIKIAILHFLVVGFIFGGIVFLLIDK